MTRSILRPGALFAALALASSITAGCADERPPINRVQSNALAKSFFVAALADPADDPEFYLRVTVVDAAAGAGNDGLFTSSDAQPTSRIRFEITEKLLLARLTYELVQDSDRKGLRLAPDGQVVAAYAIESHFDIKRDYNPTTGEEQNVIVENTTDRPYYEREYFRVDWSRNLVTDAYELDTLSQLGIYYGVRWDPVAYYVNDPSSPDAPVFDSDRGYFDVTNKAYASPEVIHDEEWGDYPACWLYGSWPMSNCNPSEIKLRQSYLRIVDTDYEPLEYTGAMMDMFGYFTDDRLGYDRRYGVVDDKWHRFAARWNVYERSHADPPVPCAESTPVGTDPHRDDGDGTEDECIAVGRGSRCDAFRGQCTIPLRDRKVKTIAWHVNPGFPDELFEGTASALGEWDEAVRVALLAGRYTECKRTKGADCEAEMQWPAPWTDTYSPPVGSSSPAEVPRVFVLCHNPVAPDKGDAPECGPAGTSPRLGDLRYNFINVIQEPQETSPWGIMVDAEDPLTGEKIAGSVNEWGGVLDRAASTLVDLLSLLNGEIAPEDFIKGKNVSEWVKSNQPGGPAERPKAMSARELAARKAAIDPAAIEPYLAGVKEPKTKKVPPAVKHETRLEAMLDGGRLGPGNAALSARLRHLRGSSVEAAMVSPEMAQAAGADPTATVSSDAIRRASPFGPMNPTFRRDKERAARAGRAARHACRLEAPEPDNLLGMAKQAAAMFPTPDPNDAAAVNAHREQVYLWARQQYNLGVLAHELGHSMGLRHNFAASFDSLNYEPQYWQIRTRNGEVTDYCPDGNADGVHCVGPRWKDPITQEEIEANIGRYSITSVMDYPGDQNQDQLLPGKYDRAAVRFGYGGVVDVWADEGLSVKEGSSARGKAYELTAFTTNPGLFAVYYFPPVDPFDPYVFLHYSQYANEFGLVRDCHADDSAGAVLGKTCSEPPLSVVDYRDMQDFTADPDYASFSWAVNSKAVDPDGRVRRGYLFSSDEFADTGNVPAFSNDAGADAYEQVRFLESAYENRYILDAFRRNRVTFNSWDTTARLQARYFDNIEQIAKTFAFGAVLDGDPTQPSAGLLEDGFYGPLGMSATVALDLFARILTRPEPGWFCEASNPDCVGGVQPYGVDTSVFVADQLAQPELYPEFYDFHLPMGPGRYVHNDYDYSQGYWWSDYQTQVGAYYEKIWAVYYLSEAFDYFVSNSKEDFTDGRYKNVSFATVFPTQVRRLYAGLLTGDYEGFAPWVDAPPNSGSIPEGTMVYPAWYEKDGPGARPAGAKLIDPNYAFNEQLYAMVWGAMFFPTNWSTAWVHDARIAVLASDQVDWPPNETYAFRDPKTGLLYRAHAAGTESLLGDDRQKGTGARMLAWANRLVTVAYLVERDGTGLPLADAFGAPILILDAQGKPQLDPQSPGADASLQKYVDQIDLFRQLTAEFAHPLYEGGLPEP